MAIQLPHILLMPYFPMVVNFETVLVCIALNNSIAFLGNTLFLKVGRWAHLHAGNIFMRLQTKRCVMMVFPVCRRG